VGRGTEALLGHNSGIEGCPAGQQPRAKENNGAPGPEGSKKKGSAPSDAAAASETKGKGAKKGKKGAK
jgi:hypothetical protein